MTRQWVAVRFALLLLCAASLPAQKKVAPKAIRFQGAPEYTQQELVSAAGFRPDARLTSVEVKARARQLGDTGFFKEVRFTSDSKGLLFTLTPTSPLYPMRLENVPLAAGKELDARLHDRFPLYHRLLPASGSIDDGICHELQEMLAANNVKAVVKATLTSDLGPKRVTAMNFAIASPAVHIGRIEFAGVSPALEAKASLLAGGQTGNSFDTENSATGLQRTFEEFYKDQGYAAVEVNVAQTDPLVVSDQSIDVPYTITIKEGGMYKLGSIDYPSGALVPRAEIEKTLSKKPTGAGRPLDLFLLTVCDAYHAKGYLDCSVVTHPSFNEATHIVNYGLEIVPGPQYRFASVKFDGAPDAMAAKLKLLWKMAPGDVFDEGYVAGFSTQAQKKDKSLARWIQSVIATYDVKADPSAQVVNCAFHFAKADQSPH